MISSDSENHTTAKLNGVLPPKENIMSRFIKLAEESIGISSKNLTKIQDMLNQVLADQHVLQMKIHGFHWNVKSELFPQLHKLFDDQYEQLNEAIDATAERCVMLGGEALGSLAQMLEKASLKEVNGKIPPKDMVKELVDDHETCIKSLRKFVEDAEDLGDMGTNDFFIGLMQDHEKMAWFLRAML